MVCRYIAHNGEINTLKGNVNLVHAREGVMSSSVFADDLYKLYPIIEPDMSDSGCFDNVVEFLCYAGQRQLPEVCMFGGSNGANPASPPPLWF